MRLLSIHNFYLQAGGEDTVFHLEAELLRKHGHTVVEYTDDNHRIKSSDHILVALGTIWSQRSYNKIRGVIRESKPDVAHFHNFFPLISPSAYYACRDEGVPVVQTIHNPRLICPVATFYRDGHLCLDCFQKPLPWPGIIHACYHDSHVQTAVVASMIWIHHLLKTWQNLVDIYVASTNFYKQIFVKAGFPSDKIVVKPHFVHNSSPTLPRSPRKYALFVGRLDPEKGIRTLVKAWTELEIPLKIRGAGQLELEIRSFVEANNIHSIEFIDHLSSEELSDLICNAQFLIFPSEGYYETFGMVVVESYARGVPVLASRIGVMTEMIFDGQTGLHFNPGEPGDLAEKARWLWEHPIECQQMGIRAKELWRERFSSERGYEALMNVYGMVKRNDTIL